MSPGPARREGTARLRAWTFDGGHRRVVEYTRPLRWGSQLNTRA